MLVDLAWTIHHYFMGDRRISFHWVLRGLVDLVFEQELGSGMRVHY